MRFTLKATASLVMLIMASPGFAANTGGYATTSGGNVTGAKSFTAKTYQEINSIVAAARVDANGNKVNSGAYPLIITYTGNEDSLIKAIVDSPCGHWDEPYREVSLKGFTKGITIQGANGSSGNFGITMVASGNVIIRNMKLGALGGASKDADLIRIDNSPNVWIDHNELFSVNKECAGSPEGDLTFEGAMDVKNASDNVTFSYNYIHDHKKVGLMGAHSTNDAGMRHLTYHHNIYHNVASRLPLQRGGRTHMYNNHYDGITTNGINIRAGGYSLIEKNYFENSKDPVVSTDDTGVYGNWDLRNNNTTKAADNATYGIKWSTSGGKFANTWTTSKAFPDQIPYSYEPVTAACVKQKLASYAGVGKNGAQLTAAACGGSSSSSSSSKSSSSSQSSASSGPALTGTGDFPDGFSKCADEGETCSVNKGTGWVAYGRKGKWVAKQVGVGKSIACTKASFGSDPGGAPNKCSLQN